MKRHSVVTRQPSPTLPLSPRAEEEKQEEKEEKNVARLASGQTSLSPDDTPLKHDEDETNDWEVGLFDCCYLGCCKCVLAFIPCLGGRFIIAEALSEMEGGGTTCFHFFCMSAPVGRTYMRRVYRIQGRPGTDCCLSLCCCGCAAAQMLGHVYIAGPPVDRFPPVRNELSSNFVAMPRQWRDCVCLDPCNVIHILMCTPCTSASHAAAVTGTPFWLFCCYSCYCTNHHLVRMNYGIPGTSQWNDCVEPFLCLGLGLTVFPFVITPICCCCYFVQMLENERLAIKTVTERGLPKLFLRQINPETSSQNSPSQNSPELHQHQPLSDHPTPARSSGDDDRPKTVDETAREVASAVGPWLLSYGALTAFSFWFRSRLLPWGVSSLASHLDAVA